MNKKKKQSWHQAFVIALIVLMALLLICSRGYRAARRIRLPDNKPTEQNISVKSTEYHNTTGRHNQSAEMKQTGLYAYQNINREMLLGKLNPATDPGFAMIDDDHASRPGMYMRREGYKAFRQMHQAARKEGIDLTIISATRTFDHQQRIWENKWNGRQGLHGDILAPDIADATERAREILRFSAMPGTSRHHWGTDIDLNSLNNDYFESGEGKKMYRWMKKNASVYGFCQPYTANGRLFNGGYEEEKWHWSYYPLATRFLDAFQDKVSYDDIESFDGAHTARKLEVIERYVLNVDRECF